MSILPSFILRTYIFLWKFIVDAKSLFLYGAEDPYARWAILFLKHWLTLSHILYIAYFSCWNCDWQGIWGHVFKGPTWYVRSSAVYHFLVRNEGENSGFSSVLVSCCLHGLFRLMATLPYLTWRYVCCCPPVSCRSATWDRLVWEAMCRERHEKVCFLSCLFNRLRRSVKVQTSLTFIFVGDDELH